MNRKIKTIIKWSAVLTLGLTLGGCAGGNIPDAKSAAGRNPQLAEVPQPDETVRGENDPAIVTLDLGTALHEHRLSGGDDLPGSIIIPTTNLNAVPITAALQAVLTGTDVSLSWDTGTLGDRLVTVMNVSGPLPKVVGQICSAAKVFCAFRHGSLELSEKETFIVSMPPLAKTITSTSGSSSSSSSSSGGSSSGAGGSSATFSFGSSGTNTMVESLNQLINGKAQVDEQGGNIIYTTDVMGEERVSRYLEQLRNGRPLVVLQMYVWEVTLNKESAEGINWSALKVEDLGPGFARLALSGTSAFTSLAGASGGMSLGAVTTGRLNTSSLISFLSTQGRVQTISSPQVTFVSGSSAELKVGGTQRYISQVGQLVASNNTSGTSNANTTSGVGTNTVSTDSITTGLTVSVNGAYENNIVFANLGLSLTNLVSLNPTASGGGTIDLPQTTDESINTVIRVRPGDNLVMAGLVTSSDINNRQGVPIGADGRLPTYGDDKLENHELVVVVKPSVVLFSDKKSIADARSQETARPLPDAMLIDKDGSKAIAIPKPQAQAAPSAPTPATLPEPGPVAIMPSADGAPIDRSLMQRGFSHAFDDMLQPAPASLAAGGAAKP